MTRRRTCLIAGIGLIAVALLVSAQVVSQEKAPPEKAPSEGEQAMGEMMAKWMKLNAKGAEHKKFEKMVGVWDHESKCWMAPGCEPTPSKGHAEFSLILDGRYIQQKYFSEYEGKPFEGISLEGYDNMKKKYVTIWMDNMSTGISMSMGTTDKSGKVTTYFGKMDDPMTGEKDKEVKYVAKEISDDKVVFSMFEKRPQVGEFKTMEITYTRRK